MKNVVEIVNEFYNACNNKQGQGIRDFISDSIMFEGPMMKISGGDRYVKIVEPLCKFHKGMYMFKQFVDGDHVMSIYEMTLDTPSGKTLKINFADWIKVVGGKIAEQKLYYDPREFAKAFNM